MTETVTPAAPIAWRIAAGHRLVELDWVEADLVDIWVVNIWKEYSDLPPVEAVNKWYSLYEAEEAKIQAGTHQNITPEIAWGRDYELAWGELVFGEYDWEATLVDAYKKFRTEGGRPARVVAQEDFDSMPEETKAGYLNRVRPPKQVWVPPTK